MKRYGRRLRLRVPVVSGNVRLPVEKTSPVALCTHCNAGIMLAWNSDAGEVVIAHDHPPCALWLTTGSLYIGRNANAPTMLPSDPSDDETARPGRGSPGPELLRARFR